MRLAIAVLLLLPFTTILNAAPPRVLVMKVDSAIAPITTEMIGRGLHQAQQQNHDAVLLLLNTPGGLSEAMRQSMEKIIASPVPVIAYVSPSGGRAASAGFFLLESGDIAAMAPGTNTGAAHPVLMNGQMDGVMKQKVANDAAALIRSVTAKRGRNSELAEKTVYESKSFTEKEALDSHLIEIVAADESDLLRQLDGRRITRFNGSARTLHLKDASLTTFETSLRERVLIALTDPNLALIFLAVGALGIYAEFTVPGMIFPGVAGAICAVLALAALSVLPISALGATLLVFSLILFALELKFASHGVLGMGGAVAMVLGATLLVDSPIPELRVRLLTAIAIALPFAVITMFLLSMALRARRGKAISGAESMVGQIATVVEEMRLTGRVFVHGEYWNATSPQPLSPGAKARVVAVHGLELTVEPLPDM